jgi:hypothetical protein
MPASEVTRKREDSGERGGVESGGVMERDPLPLLDSIGLCTSQWIDE